MKKALAGGCFNKIHEGHIYFLNEAKKYGKLTVVISHDKNNNKPYAVPAEERKRNIAALGIADHVIIGHPTDFESTVKKINPDVIVLGYDQKMNLEYFKGKIVRIDKYKDYSTSAFF